MSDKEHKNIDPRLQGTFRNVLLRVGAKIQNEFIRLNITDAEGNPNDVFTEEGQEVFAKNLYYGIGIPLSNAKLDYPEGMVPDEIELSNLIVDRFGEPHITKVGNLVGVRFDGDQPLFRKMINPLNISEATAGKNGDHARVTGIVRNLSFHGVGRVNEPIYSGKQIRKI